GPVPGFLIHHFGCDFAHITPRETAERTSTTLACLPGSCQPRMLVASSGKPPSEAAMRTVVIFSLAFLLPAVAAAQELTLPLASKDHAAGWIMLFDGETPYGWTSDLEKDKERRSVELTVDAGALVVGALKNKGLHRASSPACFDSFELSLEYRVQTRGEV